MQRKVQIKLFVFGDNCIWIVCFKLFLLRREYLSSAVNVLANSYKVLDITKRDISQLIYLQNDY